MRAVEAIGSGDTVDEANAAAAAVVQSVCGADAAPVFVVLSEGDAGLMGVGKKPALVLARLEDQPELTPVPARVEEVLTRIVAAIDDQLRVAVGEGDHRVTASISGEHSALVIGRHGQTIDSISHLVSALALSLSEDRWEIVIDAAGYRERREQRLHAVAERAAERAIGEGRRQDLEPMSSAERRIVHMALADRTDVETTSEGREPARFVVVLPSA